MVGVHGGGLLTPCWPEIHPEVKERQTGTVTPVPLSRARLGNFLLDPISCKCHHLSVAGKLSWHQVFRVGTYQDHRAGCVG